VASVLNNELRADEHECFSGSAGPLGPFAGKYKVERVL
jgi:hypothetical protein